MMNRTMIFASALTAAGSMAAYADTVGEDLSVKGKVLENAAEVGTEAKRTVDMDARMVKGATVVSTGTEITGSPDMGVIDEANDPEVSATTKRTEPENILAMATKGTTVRTVTGDVLGEVAYTEDQGSAGHLVFVTLEPEAGLQVPTVGIQVKSLQTVETGAMLEYAFSVEYLRDRIADALNKS